MAIIESMNRMQKEAGEEDLVFRIGGDEFVMLTNRTDRENAEDICERIRKYNGQTVTYEGKEIPLDLHIGAVKFEGKCLRYRDLFEQLHMAIDESK